MVTLVATRSRQDNDRTIIYNLYCSHCDDDDIFTTDHIEILLKSAIARNAEFISAAYAHTSFDLRMIETFLPASGDYGIGGIQTVLFSLVDRASSPL